MGFFRKKYLLNDMVSYRIWVKVKNLRTGKFDQKTMTWRKPFDMPENVADYEVVKIMNQFEDKVKKQALGMVAQDSKITFVEYASNWVDNIPNGKSMNYYVKARGVLKKIEKYFDKIKLCDLNPVLIQGFIDEMTEKGYVKIIATSNGTKDFRQYLKSHGIRISDLVRNVPISKSTFIAIDNQEHFSYDNAMKLCDYLGIKFEDYFKKIEIRSPYAKETIKKVQRLMSAILATAKRKRLIENNYATREYIEPILGEKKEVRILSIEEAKQLIKFLMNSDVSIRWKTAVYIPLFTGLRRGELGGLEWKDIDFERKLLFVRRSLVDVGTFGKFVKEPKTEDSLRVITISDFLLDRLREYKKWWDETACYMGDMWSKTDRLFCNDLGKDISMHLFIVWLHKILEMAGLPKVTLHALRHTNITIQLVSGVDIKTVSARAGHARASTTSDLYSHYLRQPDYQASQILNQVLGDNKKDEV